MEKNQLPNYHLKNEAIESTRQFHSLCWKKFRQKGFDISIRFCWNDSACTLFRPTLSSCFLEVCPATFFAEASIFLPFTSSAIFSTANSIKSTPTRFAAGTVYLRKNGIVVILITCASAPKHLSLCRLIPLQIGIYACFGATTFNVCQVRKECWRFFFHINLRRVIPTDKKCVFSPLVPL